MLDPMHNQLVLSICEQLFPGGQEDLFVGSQVISCADVPEGVGVTTGGVKFGSWVTNVG